MNECVPLSANIIQYHYIFSQKYFVVRFYCHRNKYVYKIEAKFSLRRLLFNELKRIIAWQGIKYCAIKYRQKVLQTKYCKRKSDTNCFIA